MRPTSSCALADFKATRSSEDILRYPRSRAPRLCHGQPGVTSNDFKAFAWHDSSLTNGYVQRSMYHGRARWGTSGALYPQTAVAGSNSLPRPMTCRNCSNGSVLTVGSCAAEAYEPRQVRKKATVSRSFWVPQGCLARAGWLG